MEYTIQNHDRFVHKSQILNTVINALYTGKLAMLSSRLSPLRSSHYTLLLGFYPSQLTTFEIVQVILVFIFRTLLGKSGFAATFDIQDVNTDNERYMLPDIGLSMPFRIAEEDLLAYAAAIGSSARSLEEHRRLYASPAQLCLMLSAFSEPAFLLLLSHHKCPIQPLGSVNVRNRFELLRADLCSWETFARTDWEVRASFVNETKQVKRGLEIDVVDEIVKIESNTVVFRQIFTMLRFMKLGRMPKGPEKVEGIPAVDMTSNQADVVEFRMEKSITMLWAQVCKDYNPIHTSYVAAKLFGFTGRIAHGNHAVALGLQQLHVRRESQAAISTRTIYIMEVQFRRPIVLPGRLKLQATSEGEGTKHFSFQLVNNHKECVTGVIREVRS